MNTDIINKYYEQYNFPSLDKLYKLIKIDNKNITKNEIKDFLLLQSEAQILKENKQVRKKKLHPIASLEPNVSFQIDIFDLKKYSKNNKGYAYIFAVIDIFSRIAYCLPMKKKGIDDTTDALKEILKTYKLEPKMITSDSDSSFLGGKFQALLKKHNILHNKVVINDHHALGLIDRFTRTLKTIISKYFIRNNNTKWEDSIIKIVHKYNNTPNSGINDIKPDEAIKNIETLQDINISKMKHATKNDITIIVGDHVRTEIITTFKKKTEGRFSNTVYTVTDVRGKRATLSDGKTYRVETLLKVSPDTVSKPSPIQEVNKESRKDRRILKAGVDVNDIVEGKRIKKANPKFL